MRAVRRPLLAGLLLVGALAALAAPAPRQAAAAPLPGDALLAAIRTRRVKDVRFENATVDQVVAWLRLATGWNYDVRRHVLAKAGVDVDAIRVTLLLDDVTVAEVLDLAFGAHGLAILVDRTVIAITTKADALGPPVTVIYGISRLTWAKTNFVAPDIDLYPSGARPPERAEEEIDESDPFLDPQHVVDLVKEMVDAPWSEEGYSLRATKQHLIVKAPRPVQREVARAVAVMAEMK